MATNLNILQSIDIGLVFIGFYMMIQKIKGTRTIQMLKGLSIIIYLNFISGLIGINLVSNILDQLISNYGVVVIVIFHPEIRRALELLGQGNVAIKYKGKNCDLINCYDKALQYMSIRKIGALITIERCINLDPYVDTGIRLNADVTGELLINIFIPNTPLHDGAVIIRGGKVLASCAYLPLSNDETLSKEFGTRHRAALGISEVTDAITMIVSEETGQVSLSLDNTLFNNLRREEYLAILKDKMVIKEPKDNEVSKFIIFRLYRRLLKLIVQGSNSSLF